jgi:uncharacterized protein YcbX
MYSIKMAKEIGHVESIFRYPAKSMAGERLDVAALGWHGIDGDRRLALRRMDANERNGFPWLTAGKLPDLLRYVPLRRAGESIDREGNSINRAGNNNRNVHDAAGGDLLLPTHVRTPDGDEMPTFGDGLAKDIERRYGAPVQMMRMKHGIFDEASISVIALDTVDEISRLADKRPDVRRFRPNIVIRLIRSAPFQEDEWLGSVLTFGDAADAAAITVTIKDDRCSMVNLDPDSATASAEVLKAIVRANQNHAGVYAVVTRIGQVAAGQVIRLHGPAKYRNSTE